MTTPVDLTPTAEHRRGHGAMYDALNSGNVDVPRLRQVLAGLPQSEAADGRLVLAVDVTHWLRPDAPTSPDRLLCHVHGRSGRSSDQSVPGWPYSFVAALESGRSPPRAAGTDTGKTNSAQTFCRGLSAPSRAVRKGTPRGPGRRAPFVVLRGDLPTGRFGAAVANVQK